ncbi:MAG: PAS domain-containing sensor histidine kinase [Anaerolineae bacterium]|nr:PAS domain-containing sensor histidine kinase [Anaerolineae bacterium]
MDPVLAELILKDRKIAYVVADGDLNVLESGGAVDILRVGLSGSDGALLDLIPEFVGSEKDLASATLDRSTPFQLARVNRVAPDGSTHYLTLDVLPYSGYDSRATLLVIGTDVSEQGQYAQMLTQQRNESQLLLRAIDEERGRLRALIESSRDGILFVGMDSEVLIVNAPAIEFLHMPGKPQDWTRRPIREALNWSQCQALAKDRFFRQEIEPPGEGECGIPPRIIHWLNLPVVVDGAPLGRLLILRDVTDERALEKMRDDLIHTMVHDLRNPLTAISLSLQFLEIWAADFTPDQRTALQGARNGTEGMLQLVNGILDVSRLESGRMPLEHARVSLGTLVVDVLRGQAPLIAEKDLRLESDLPPDLPPAWADVGLIGRVLQNLIGNAVKFTPPGGLLKVTVSQNDEEQEAGAPCLLVSVIDSGPGIPSELQAKLFQKFITGPREERGSGLGLAFCRLAVEAHGGRIWAESSPEEGTAFHFTLPIAKAG